MSTLAGTSQQSFWDGANSQARFGAPFGIAVDDKGSIFVADYLNQRIRLIRNGLVSTLAGNGNKGSVDGPAGEAQFNGPRAVCVGLDGTVYVAECGAHRIRTIKDGLVSTLAGTGTAGNLDGPANKATFNSPVAVIADKTGAVYVSDLNNHRIRLIKDGQVTGFAGTGQPGFSDGPIAAALFQKPYGLAIDRFGTIYVSDQHNHSAPERCQSCLSALTCSISTGIRVIKNGNVSTLAGSSPGGCVDGPVAQAQLWHPQGIAVDEMGMLYIADCANHRIRSIQLPGFNSRASYIDVSSCLEESSPIGVTKAVKINNIDHHVHEALIRIRCPQLLIKDLSKIPVDPESTKLFLRFVYSEQLPPHCKTPQWLGLSYLLSVAGFSKASLKCLRQLTRISIAMADILSIEDLVRLYSYALDLEAFPGGIQACLSLLRRYRSRLPLPELPELLKIDPSQVLKLAQQLLQETSPDLEIVNANKSEESHSLSSSLKRLLKTKVDADFEIIIGDQHVFKCHSFVLAARWPYFRHMLDAKMNEAQKMQLKIPAPAEDGGLHPVSLQAAIDVCYVGKVTKKTRAIFTPAHAIDVLSVKELYFDWADASLKRSDGDSYNTFDPLFAFAQVSAEKGLESSNAAELYTTALELHMDDLAQKALDVISSRLHEVWAHPTQREILLLLPQDKQLALLWFCFSNLATAPAAGLKELLESAGVAAPRAMPKKRVTRSSKK